MAENVERPLLRDISSRTAIYRSKIFEEFGLGDGGDGRENAVYSSSESIDGWSDCGVSFRPDVIF